VTRHKHDEDSRKAHGPGRGAGGSEGQDDNTGVASRDAAKSREALESQIRKVDPEVRIMGMK